jgi:D-lactate dehydrogenase (cytochrome)
MSSYRAFRLLRGRPPPLHRNLSSAKPTKASSSINNNAVRIRIVAGIVAGAAIGFYFSMNQTFKNPPEFLFPHSSKTSLNDIPSPSYGTKWDYDLAKEKLIALLGDEHVSNTSNDIENHSTNSYTLHEPTPDQRPKLIVYPGSTEDVSAILKIVHDFKIPVLAYGGGTSIEGQYISTRRGIVIDMSRLNKIIKINKDDLDITVQAGVTWQEINEAVDEYGLLFGPDPGPGAQIGGSIATSCSGTNASRYGTMKENVVNLTVVLADGSIIKTQRRPKKSSNGYNLNSLFVGSEGTLGIVTEATVKLHVKPKYETIAVATFNTIVEATDTVTELIQNGIQPNAVELLDERMMACINFANDSAQWDVKPTLFFKLGNNNQKILKEIINEVQAISKRNKGLSFKFAKNKEQQFELWQARKSIFWSSIDYGRSQISPNVKIWSTDVAVPISNLSKMIQDTLDDSEKSGLYTTIVGHVGDGNFHCLVMYDEEDRQRAMALADRMVDRALYYEGTCSGEHGVGYAKRHHLQKELGVDTIDVMRKIKLSLDPLRILNPDKIFKIDPFDKNH